MLQNGQTHFKNFVRFLKCLNPKPNSTVSVMPCIGATFAKKNSCLVARTVPFDTVGLPLLTFGILEPYPSEDILTLMAWL